MPAPEETNALSRVTEPGYVQCVRRSTKIASFFLCSLATAAAIVACVGDDAAVVTGSTPPGSETGTDPPGPDGSKVDTDGGAAVDSAVDSASGADAALPPLDVKTLPGLRLWLESTQGLTKAAVGSDLVSWRDSSQHWADGGVGAPDGGAHTATPVPFSGGGAVYPGIVANGIAARPSVTFESGPKLAIANHDDFNPGTGDFVIAAVAAVSSGTGPFWRLMKQTSVPSGVFFGTSMSCTAFGVMGTPPCTAPEYPPSTAPHVFVVRRKLTQLLFRVDSTSRASYDLGATNPDLGVLTFQQPNAFIGGGVVGQLSELVFLVGDPTDPKVDKLEAYLKTKYMIP